MTKSFKEKMKEVFALNSCKCIKKIINTRYFLEAPFSAIASSSLFEYDATSLANLFFGQFLPFFIAEPFILHQVEWGHALPTMAPSVDRYVSFHSQMG